MSLAITLSQKSYVGTGGTTVFPTTFAFKAAADLLVEVAPAATGVFVTKLRGVDYYVVADGAAEPGSQVVFSIAPASGDAVRITRVTPLVQPVALPPAGAFLPATHEGEFDRLTMMVQEHDRRLAALEAGGSTVISGTISNAFSSLTPSGELESNFPFTVPCFGTPLGVKLVRVDNLTTPGKVRYDGAFDWYLPVANQFTVKYIGGLSIGDSYDFTFEVTAS